MAQVEQQGKLYPCLYLSYPELGGLSIREHSVQTVANILFDSHGGLDLPLRSTDQVGKS